MNILYVYKISNKINGKVYIGKHSSKKLDNGYYGSGMAIKKAISKYGKNNFEKHVLEVCNNEDELNKKEIYYIELYNTFCNGYNMTKGGEGMLGHRQSKESIIKASFARKKHYENNPKTREVLSQHAKKKTGSKNPFFGKKLSKEHIEKMTASRVLAISGGKNPSAVKLLCIENGMVFDTAKDAANFCGLKHSTTILKAAKANFSNKTAGSYTWKILN